MHLGRRTAILKALADPRRFELLERIAKAGCPLGCAQALAAEALGIVHPGQARVEPRLQEFEPVHSGGVVRGQEITHLAAQFTPRHAAGRNSTASGREIHAAVGTVTAGMYLTTASFAIFAPKIPATKTRGQIRLHKALALIHGPGMILTPILGEIAYQQRSNGEKVHGIASAHGAVGAVTGIAYGAAILSVVIKF